MMSRSSLNNNENMRYPYENAWRTGVRNLPLIHNNRDTHHSYV